MPIDIDPVVSSDRQLVQAYGDRAFKITGETYSGSVIVFATETVSWAVEDASEVSMETLLPVIDGIEGVDILLVGCGPSFLAVPKGLRAGLKDRGIGLEWMDTGAACRTFNVLIAEERRVAAALIAIE